MAYQWLIGTCLLVAVFASSCGGSSPTSRHVPDGLTEDQTSRLRSKIAEIEGHLGFAMLIPTYVPAGLDPFPNAYYQTEFGADGQLAFGPPEEGSPIPEPSYPAVLRIIESKVRATSLGLAGGDAQFFTFMGYPAASEETTGADPISYDFRFRKDGILVIIQLFWNSPSESPLKLSEAMKQEAFKVAASMLSA